MNKIVCFEGGSGFGKSTTIKLFENNEKFALFPSITKEVHKRIGKDWSNNPAVQFADIYFHLRLKQYQEVKNLYNHKNIIFDRFLLFPIAIRVFSKIPIPDFYLDTINKVCKIDKVFIFEPIPLESFEEGWPRKSLTYKESILMNDITYKVAHELNINTQIVPFLTLEARKKFIKKNI